MHFLLIDDEVRVMDTLALYLRHLDHTSTSLRYVANEGRLKEFLEQTQPDAVILDFAMEQSGDDVYRWIKDWKKDLKIVFYTAYGRSPLHRHQMLAAGASDPEIVEKREVGTDIRDILKALS